MSLDTMNSHDHVEDLKNYLSIAARDGKWREFLKRYKDNKHFRTAKITETGGTVLHMAVSSGKDRVVETMVDLVCGERINEQDNNSPLLLPSRDENDGKEFVLGAKDDEGNTPLHLAASMGYVEMCKKISGVDPILIAKRNNAGETPLFMAALHGKRKPFLWLYYQYTGTSGVSSTDIAHCIKRDNDDTILHCALEERYFDVAIEIVLLSKNRLIAMVLIRNKKGLSPIHLLAATPSVFQSTHIPTLPLVGQLLYYCTFLLWVKQKKQATTKEELEKRERRPCVLALWVAFRGYMSNRFEGSRHLIGLLYILAALLLLPLFALEKLCVLAEQAFHLIRRSREVHVWSVQIVEELLQYALPMKICQQIHLKRIAVGSIIVDTPLMIAAQNGITEMVKKILEYFPSTLKVVNEEGKNTVLLAAEKRLTKVYQILCENKDVNKSSAFRQLDKDGNTALHLAAKLEVNINKRTTTMVEEYKWFEFVKNSLHFELWEKYNNGGKTAEDIFIDSYREQMSRDREWLNQTSQACSVVSTLVASMAFANVAVNFDEKNNSSLVALSLSLTSTISFLAILASRSQSLTFWRYVPFMLHIAIFAMFGSIVSLWISLMLHDHSFKTYVILGSPIAILTIVSLPIFIGPTLISMFTKVPSPSNKTTSAIRYQRPQKMQTLQKNAGSGTELPTEKIPTEITEGSKKCEIEQV